MSLHEDRAIQVILGRRSIRKFQKDRKVEPEKLDIILECAQAAPTAGGGRPWHFVVVEDRHMLDALAEAHPYGKMLHEAPLAIVVCGDPKLNDFAKRYWEEDCSAAMQNILLASHALGLGSVWLGVSNSPGRPEAVRKALGIPDDIQVLAIAAIGYPAETKEPHSGYDHSRIHRNRW